MLDCADRVSNSFCWAVVAFLGPIVPDDEDGDLRGRMGCTDVSTNCASEECLRGAEAIADASRSY